MKRVVVSILAGLIACGGAPHKQQPPPPPPHRVVTAPPPPPISADDAVLPLWGEVKKGVLPNGLTYYIYKHGKPAKRAFMWLAVNAGSILEDDDQRGLAHFDEHMAFNGTKRFPKAAIVNYLEKIGMQFGADLNAYTNYDETVYQLQVPTDDPSFISKGLDILRDWAGDVSYDPVEVDKERGVVLEEWRLGRGAQQRLLDKQAPILFKGSRYADRTTIGLPDIIKKAPRDTLHRFYKDWYRPDLMAVIAVGDFDPVAMEKEIQARFGDLVNPASERKRIHGEVPKADGTRVSIETDKEMPGLVVSVYNELPHRSESSKKDYRRIIAEQVYTTILNERLASLGRKAESPYAQAGAGAESITREIDAFVRTAQAKDGKLEDTLRSLFTEVVRVEKHGFTQTELDRARANLLRFYEQAAAEEGTAESTQYTDEITRNFFENELMIGRVAERNFSTAMLPTITVDELNTLAKTYGGAENRVILIAGPDGAKLPDKARVLAIIDEVAKADLAPWEDKTSTAKLMTTPPAPGKVVKETKNDKLGTTEWTLSNGVVVIVKPTDFEADSVIAVAQSPGGEAMAKDKDWMSDHLAEQVAELGGVGDFDAESLEKMLAGKHVTVGTSIGDTMEGVAATASAKDIETMFQLIYLKMTAPRKDAAQFKVLVANAGEALTNQLRVPEVQYQRQSQMVLFQNNLRRKPIDPEDLSKIDIDKALAFYKDRFGDASDFTFVIVGVVDLATLKPLVETYLASLPAKGRKEVEKDQKIRLVPGVVKKTWNIGQEPKARVQITFHADEAWARDKDRDMYILSQVLAIRLREVLREDMGGVYGVSAAGEILRGPHQQRDLTISFGCAPENVDKLIAATFDEIAAIQKKGIGDDYLEKVKQAFVREREVQLKSNDFWSGWLANAARYHDDATIIFDPTGMTKRATSANVQAAAKRYADKSQYYQSVLLPEKK